MSISGLESIAIPTNQPTAMLEFYRGIGILRAGGKIWRDVANPRLTIQCGNQKVNLHGPSEWQDKNFILRGHTALPGCGDVCFVWDSDLDSLLMTLQVAGAAVEAGPVERSGDAGLVQASIRATRMTI